MGSERDVGVGVLVDVLRREVIRKWGGGIVVLSLARRSGEWILERVSEGAGIVLAAARIGAGGGTERLFNIAFLFRGGAALKTPRGPLVIGSTPSATAFITPLSIEWRRETS